MKHLLPLISVSDSDNYSTSKRVRHLNDLAKVRTIHLQQHTHTYTRFISGGQGVLPPLGNWLFLYMYVIWGLLPLKFAAIWLPPLEQNPEINPAHMHMHTRTHSVFHHGQWHRPGLET